MAIGIGRRAFVSALGGAAFSWSFPTSAQQPAMPVVGSLLSGTSDESKIRVDAFRQGLKETGYIEGRSVAIEYRYADNQYGRLPELAAELVRRQVAVIFAGGGGVAPQAAKAATTTIPIIFTGGLDPVQAGLVASLNRPGGNVTGVTFLTNALEAKRLGMLHELVPHAHVIAVLFNPHNASAKRETGDLTDAALALGLVLRMARASGIGEIEPAFADFSQVGAEGLLVASDAFLSNQAATLAALAASYKLPAISNFRDFPDAGGLASYGTSRTDAYRQAGTLVGRILRGEKPADLPVFQSTKFDFVMNLKAAKALGLSIPPSVLAIADEVIE